jgi:hypothetical protein
VRLTITRLRTKLPVYKSRPEAVVEVSACVCDNVKRVFEWRVILKNAGKRVSKLLGTKHYLFRTTLPTADSSCRSGEIATAWLAGRHSTRRAIILYRCCVLNDGNRDFARISTPLQSCPSRSPPLQSSEVSDP